MSCGAIWLPFLSTRADDDDDDDAPASSPAMRPDPPPEESPAPAAKSAPAPAEAALSSPVAIPPLEPRLRIHYDGPLRWNDHPELTQRLEDATAALEAAGWTSVLQHMPKGVRTPEGVFSFMPTLHAVMNVKGVTKTQLTNRLASKRSKQRAALPYPFGAGVSHPDPEPEPVPKPVPVQEREQLVLGYESKKFGSLKKLTDSLATILPGDDNPVKLGKAADRSPSSTEPSIKRRRRRPLRRVDEPLDPSEEREMVRESIRRSLVEHGTRDQGVGEKDVDAFIADVMNIEDDGLGDDSSPEQGTPVAPTDDEDEDEDEETLAGMLDRHKKQIQAKAAMKKTVNARKSRLEPKARARARGAVVQEPPPPPPTDAFALPRREPFKMPKIAMPPHPMTSSARLAWDLAESKLAAGDPVRAEVAIEEFSNAAMAIGSQSHGEAARALTRLAGMNIPFEVLSKLGDCPKHVKRWAKSGGTREIRDAASLCVERWEKVARTSQEEGFRVWVREEAARARRARDPEPEPEPEPFHHDSRATFASGYYASPDRRIDPEVAYLESHADRAEAAMDGEEALGRAITALNASPGKKTSAPEPAAFGSPHPNPESEPAAPVLVDAPPPPPILGEPVADVIAFDDEKDDEKDATPAPVLMEVPPPPPPPPPCPAVAKAPPRSSESPPTVREVPPPPPPPPRGRAGGTPPPPGPYGTREGPPPTTTTAPYLAPPPPDARDRNVRPRDRDGTREGQSPARPASDHIGAVAAEPGEITKRGVDETLPEPRRGDEKKRQSLGYHCPSCDCDVPANGREQHESGTKHREKEKDFLARTRSSDRRKRVVKVVVQRAGPASGDLRDRIDRTPTGPRPVVRDEIAGVVEASAAPELPVVQTTSSGWDGLPEAEAMAQPVMVPLAQGLVPMLPVTSLLPVRTARGNVVYMAPMQPILGGTSDDPGFIAVDDQVTTRINSRINSRWHASETTTTRTMTTETMRSGSETGRMTREEWELERKEKKKEKKEKKKKEKKEKREKREKKEKRKRKNEDEEEREERRAIVKSTKPTKQGWQGWMQHDDFLRLDDSYDASLQSGGW